MDGDESVACPACFTELSQPDPGAREVVCPFCGHAWSPHDDLQQTVEHTPQAKRRSIRPPE